MFQKARSIASTCITICDESNGTKREYEDGVPETVEWLEREPFWIYPFKDKNK